MSLIYRLSKLVVFGVVSTALFNPAFNQPIVNAIDLLPSMGWKYGTIAAKGTVLGPNGKPIWVEYGSDGSVVREISEAYGDPYETAYVMPAYEYRAYVDAFAEVQSKYSPNMEIIYASEYKSRTFYTPDGQRIIKLPLRANTESVVVRKPAFDNIGLILFQTPLDLFWLDDLPGNTRAVLVSKEGRLLEKSDVNIGYFVAFYTPEEALNDPIFHPEAEEGERGLILYERHKDELWAGITGARMDAFGGWMGRASSVDGHYFVPYWVPPCPGFVMIYPHRITAELWYHRFNPKLRSPIGPYLEWEPVTDICIGISELIPSTSLVGLAIKTSVKIIESTHGFFQSSVDFPIEVAMLSGRARLENESGIVPLADSTVYESFSPPFSPEKPPENMDLDGDGLPDQTMLDIPTDSVSVWLGDSDPATDPPELIRIPDYKPDLTDRGLLKGISELDLYNTDIYIYRVSSGQLITSREGLHQPEIIPWQSAGPGSENLSLIYYQMLFRGPASKIHYVDPQYSHIGNRFEAFQTATKVNEELRSVKADHLRIGEQLKVIIINRATGYIGSSVGTIGGQAGETLPRAQISFTPERITMRPPNLKIKAERKYTVDAGLTEGEGREYLIGFEGSGLTSDEVIVITTEWYDWDGSPLPSDLPGYTGRLARVVAPNFLGSPGNLIASFDIKPGINMQLVHLPQPVVDAAHYYVHVNGDPVERNPDFSTIRIGFQADP